MDTYLAKLPLFRTLPSAELRRLAKASEPRRFSKGQWLFPEGAPADSVWLIRRGWVHLLKRTPHPEPATIFTILPDEPICGISAFDQGAYTAGALAAVETEAVRIPTELFGALLERYPRFAREVLLVCSQRIRHMAERIGLGQASAEQRLAYVLLRMQEAFGKAIPIVHRELARMAGTRLETSIRTIAAFKRRGWVTSSRGKIQLLQPDELRGLLANGTASRRGV